MAVTKIHRTSRTVLIIGVLISIVVMGLFYFGGQAAPEDLVAGDLSQPLFTDLLLYWAYILLALTVIVLIGFAVTDFLRGLRENPKKALSGLLVLLILVALLVITYIMGDGTLLNIPGYTGSDNVPTMLKMTDMWLYSCYVMLVVTLLAMIVLPLLSRKK
ncbi:MAG: hypothetical protein GX371_08655 [Bacteroidales bacterium]|nr:hypothetical protein [Bacteroidales bacterium]